jgi:ABC-2 type transport system ATP-binding protein
MIVCQNLVKKYGRQIAVDQVSLRIESGMCALLGPNGAGKSTLLRLLTGLELPDGGEVKLLERDFRHSAIEIKRRIGVLPEGLGLLDALTVQEHLQLTGPIYGLTKEVARERAEQLLNVFQLSDARHTFAGQCSYGMRKKTALALALFHNPELLILDEPFEGVDPGTSQLIEKLLTAAVEHGITILLTSHTLPTVERLTSQILLMERGRIVWNSAEDSLCQPLAEKYFDVLEEPTPGELSWLGR